MVFQVFAGWRDHCPFTVMAQHSQLSLGNLLRRVGGSRLLGITALWQAEVIRQRFLDFLRMAPLIWLSRKVLS